MLEVGKYQHHAPRISASLLQISGMFFVMYVSCCIMTTSLIPLNTGS